MAGEDVLVVVEQAPRKRARRQRKQVGVFILAMASFSAKNVVKSNQDHWEIQGIVVAANFDGRKYCSTNADDEGRFTLTVPPGTVTLKCRGYAGKGAPVFTAERDVLVGYEESKDIEIVLEEVPRD